MVREMKACLNGARRLGEHPDLPLTAAELGKAASAAVVAGAEALHVHPRDRHGDESLATPDIGAAVTAIRAAAPGTPVGVSTGLWIVHGDVERRRLAVLAWAQLPVLARPDFASVNVGEPGFGELADVLEHAGIAVEAGVVVARSRRHPWTAPGPTGAGGDRDWSGGDLGRACQRDHASP